MTVDEMACMAARWMAALRPFSLQLLRPLVTRECGMIAQVCQGASACTVSGEVGKTPEQEVV